MPEIVVKKNGKTCFKLPLGPKAVRIGRSPANDLMLPDEDISRHHAEIHYISGQYLLKDLSSTGTMLSGQPVTGLTPLKDNAEISIGNWVLTFVQTSTHDREYYDEVKTCISRLEEHRSDTKIIKLDARKENFLVEETLLHLFEPGKTGRTHPLGSTPLVMGTKPDCTVVLVDPYVSGRHCSISKTENGFVLKDLGSTNGTFVDGVKISETPLPFNKEVSLGQVRFFISGEKHEEAIRPLAQSRFCGMIGKNAQMRTLFTKIERVAPTDMTVLVQAETGSGKELVAKALHDLSPRANSPYVILNCGAISASLIESELFGHEKGAFTGAVARRLGAFEQAQNGTLFLDEVGELPLDLQPKLLRVLENQTLRRVGGDEEVKVNARIVAATHRDLAELVKAGKFREDLYFRLFVIPLSIPPLRERKEDILTLAEFFLKQSPQNLTLSSEAQKKLAEHSWPGNVRELKNVILRSMVYVDGTVITPDHLEIIKVTTGKSNDVNLESMEKQKIIEAIEKAKGNKTKAAELLGIAKSTLFKKLKDYDIGGDEE